MVGKESFLRYDAGRRKQAPSAGTWTYKAKEAKIRRLGDLPERGLTERRLGLPERGLTKQKRRRVGGAAGFALKKRNRKWHCEVVATTGRRR